MSRRYRGFHFSLCASLLVLAIGCGSDAGGAPRPTATTAASTATSPPSTVTSTRPPATVTATRLPATSTPTSTPPPATPPTTATQLPTPAETGVPLGPSFEGPLTGGQEVPPVETSATGTVTLTLSEDESALFFELTVEGIESSQITQAHIHVGPPGFNGPVVLFLADGPFESPLTGTLTPDDLIPNADVGVTTFAQLIERLQAGEAYANVHTLTNPSGEVRGQLPVATRFVADLDGDQEVPPVDTQASGSATLTLSADETTLDFVIEVEGIPWDQITQAHIHVAPRGFNGPVVVFFAHGPFESPLTGTLTVDDLLLNADSGIESFADLVAALRAGDAYVNVHTQAHMGGEIRGQLQAPLVLPVDLDGSQEVPAVSTEASGRARIAVDAERGAIRFAIAVQGLAADQITQAHIHVAPEGFNGPVTTFLADGGFGSLRMGVLTDADLLPNADASVNDFHDLIDAILAGDGYVNVHSMDHPAGEIRGQIDAPITLPVTLSGAEEVDPVETTGSGRAQLTIDAERESVRYALQVEGIEAAQVTQAHIHVAPRGFNGPVVLFLADGPFQLRQGVLSEADLLANADVGVEDLADLIEALGFGDGYVNVHSMTHPAGEIRGQIRVPVVFPADPNGAAEVPPVATTASGRARVVLNAEGDALDFALAVAEITNADITQAHIHVGPPDINGGVAFFLADGPFGFRRGRLTAAEFLPVDGTPTFADFRDRLRAGGTYVNVHTNAHMDGEIRGQLLAPIVFAANLTGTGEVPPVKTEATGRAQVVLAAERDLVRFALATQNLPADQTTMAHIHVGPPDMNGPVVLFFANGGFTSPRIGSLDADDLIPRPGSGINTFVDLVAALDAGGTYANVHSITHMDGEIRGQLVK